MTCNWNVFELIAIPTFVTCKIQSYLYCFTMPDFLSILLRILCKPGLSPYGLGHVYVPYAPFVLG